MVKVNHFLIIIFVESSLGGHILKALGYLHDSVNVAVGCRVVHLARVELVNHLLLGRA